MVILFAYSNRVYIDENGEYYTSFGFSDKTWQRYKKLGRLVNTFYYEKINIESSESHRLNLIDKKNINFIKKSKKKFRGSNKKIISKAIKESDIVIIRIPNMEANLIVNLCKKFEKPYLIEVVGCGFNSLWYHSLLGKVLAIPSYLKMKRLVKKSKHVIYVTEEYLQNKYPTDGKELFCSNVEIEGIYNSEEGIKRRYSDFNKNKIKLLSVGALNVKYKAYDVVLKQLAELKKRNYKIEYYLIGSGSTKWLNKKIQKFNLENEVIILGQKSHEEVLKFMNKIDIYIHPSKTEGLPRSLIEAMSQGCFCIGSSVGGIPELLDEKYIFDHKNPNKITEIVESLSKEQVIENAIRNLHKSKEYDFDLLNERRHNFYLEFINESLSKK